jgi:16S rRNA (guanine527-N7)-methyltransferase
VAERRPDLAAALERALAAVEPAVTLEARAALLTWLQGIVEWNARIDLTAARTDDELIDLMVADALLLSRHIPEAARVVDVGSGAGAPGLALAILRPDIDMTLVEPLDKRVAFLRRSIGALGRTERLPIVVRGRGDALVAQRRKFEVAVSRATLPPPEWLNLGSKLAPEGAVWVLLAQGEAPVLEGWRVEADLRYSWPLAGVSRRALRYVR